MVVTVTARTSGGGKPAAATLQTSASVLRKRLSGIDGATVRVLPPDRLQLRAPGSDRHLFDDLLFPGVLNLRPVQAQWPAPTGTASAFPLGSDPSVRTQPESASASAVQRWEKAASAYADGGGPTCPQIAAFGGKDDPAKPLLACNRDGSQVYLLEPTVIPGTEMSAAHAQQPQQGAAWIVDVTFNSAGSAAWTAYTAAHYDGSGGTHPPPGSSVAFTLDGTVLSAPIIAQPITSANTRISGDFSETAATSLADTLDAGALPLVLTVTGRESVG